MIMVVCAACLVGCAIWAAGRRQPLTWAEPPAYVFTVRFRCGMELPPGQYTLTVDNGTVSKAVADDAYSETVFRVRKLTPARFPTLGVLLHEAQHARDDDADVAEVSFDPVDGHPTKIRLDYDKGAADDESCSDVVAFAAS